MKHVLATLFLSFGVLSAIYGATNLVTDKYFLFIKMGTEVNNMAIVAVVTAVVSVIVSAVLIFKKDKKKTLTHTPA